MWLFVQQSTCDINPIHFFTIVSNVLALWSWAVCLICFPCCKNGDNSPCQIRFCEDEMRLYWWVSIVFVCACSVVSDFLWPPWTVAHQAPLLMEFPKQEYWSGLPFSTPGDLPDWRTEPLSLVLLVLAGGFFTTEPSGRCSVHCAVNA